MSEIADLRARIKDLEAERDELKADVEYLGGEVGDLEERLSDARHAVPDYEGDLVEVRRLIARKQYDDAIELCDRVLPGRLRYAS